jgi:ribosomal protein S18 acetylase RimI-like enzyme
LSALAALRRATLADLEAVTAFQHAAYDKNRALLGVEPLPLLADYADIIATYETWLLESDGRLDGVLILDARPDDLLIWSVATAPAAQKRGVGRTLLAAAEERARALGRGVIRLYTGEPLTGNIAWYQRHGYAVERVEALATDRRIVHMSKTLYSASS